ncbi:hypothetical protein ACWIYZ_00260 [Ursidibacter arcticus]
MNCWSILEINPTSDEKEIRRAYAQKLKITRPDSDPYGYQELRAAFDYAIKIAPYYAEGDEDNELYSLSDEDSDLYSLSDEDSTNNKYETDTHILENIHIEECDKKYEEPVNLLSDEIYHITENNYDDNNESCITAFSVLRNIEDIYHSGGESALIHSWQDIQHQLGNLSFEEYQSISFDLLNFAQSNDFKIPLLWKQWANYFNWLNDYQVAQYLSVNDLENIKLKLEQAKIYLEEPYQSWDDKPSREKLYFTKDTTLVIAQALSYFIRSGKSRLLAIFYAMLVWPSISYESDKNIRYDIMAKNPVLDSIYRYAYALRYSFRTAIIFGIVFIPNSSMKLHPILFQIAILFIIFFIGGLIVVLMNWIVDICPKLDWLIIPSVIPSAFRIIFLPIIAIIILHSNYVYSELIFLILMIISWLTFMNLYSLECVATTLVCFTLYLMSSNTKDIWLLSISSYWLNINLYLQYFFQNKLNSSLYLIKEPFEEIPYDKDLLLFPFKAIRSAILWVLLLPIITKNFVVKSKDIYTILEIGCISILIMSVCSKYIDNPLLIFYPIVLGIYIMYSLIKKWVFGQLNIAIQ